MSKKDKKFISALVICQTGFIVAAISLFGKFWADSIENCKRITQMYELSEWIDDQNNIVESKKKVESFRNFYETKGIQAEED